LERAEIIIKIIGITVNIEALIDVTVNLVAQCEALLVFLAIIFTVIDKSFELVTPDVGGFVELKT